MRIGRVLALACRPAPGTALVDAGSLLLDGAGIVGDRHAHLFSPRQLLLASASAYDALALPVRALRENVLVDLDTAGLVSGTVLRIGAEATLRLMFQCEACGALDQERLGLARTIGARRGMLARVLAGGTIRSGDAIHALDPPLPAWPEDWRARVALVLAAVPPGAVIEYKVLARLAGVQSTYCRAFPRVIAKLGPAHAARAVTAGSASTSPRWTGDGLFEHDGPGAT